MAIPDVLEITRAEFEIYQAFKDILKDPIARLLQDHAYHQIEVKLGSDEENLGVFDIALSANKLMIKLDMDNGFLMSHRLCYIPMVFSMAVSLQDKYENNQNALFQEVCKIPADIKPQINEWLYEEDEQHLVGFYKLNYAKTHRVNTQALLEGIYQPC